VWREPVAPGNRRDRGFHSRSGGTINSACAAVQRDGRLLQDKPDPDGTCPSLALHVFKDVYRNIRSNI